MDFGTVVDGCGAGPLGPVGRRPGRGVAPTAASRGWACRLALAVAVTVLAGCAAEPREPGGAPAEAGSAAERRTPGPPTVRTGAGVLRGTRSEDGVAAFLAVPYAAAPVGARRWRPPAKPSPWEGVRDASEPAPACPQPAFQADFYRRVAAIVGGDPAAVSGLGAESEDCLYLNVWTPAPGRGAGLPVLVWVHGGAGTVGTATEPLFEGDRLAARGAVVVTVNYRLGPLGFLAHPALSRESARGVSGNYALLDLIEALRWIRREVAAFGGDPGRVAVAGQSSGAALVAHLMASPAAEGLLHRAVLQSGTGLGVALPLRSEERGAPSGEALGLRLAAALGVEGARDPAGALRALPADSIVAAAFASGNVPDRPVVDGRVVPEPLEAAIAAGRAAPVPVLLGTNAMETSVLVPPPASAGEYRTAVGDRYGEDAGRLLSLYPAADSSEAVRARRLLTTDDWFSAPARRMARLLAGPGAPVWLYRFERPYPAPRGEAAGAFHGAELPFLFGHFPPAWGEPGPADREMSRLLMALWLEFAATGRPRAAGAPRWPPYERGAPRVLFLRDPPSVGTLPRTEALDLFDAR